MSKRAQSKSKRSPDVGDTVRQKFGLAKIKVRGIKDQNYRRENLVVLVVDDDLRDSLESILDGIVCQIPAPNVDFLANLQIEAKVCSHGGVPDEDLDIVTDELLAAIINIQQELTSKEKVSYEEDYAGSPVKVFGKALSVKGTILDEENLSWNDDDSLVPPCEPDVPLPAEEPTLGLGQREMDEEFFAKMLVDAMKNNADCRRQVWAAIIKDPQVRDEIKAMLAEEPVYLPEGLTQHQRNVLFEAHKVKGTGAKARSQVQKILNEGLCKERMTKDLTKAIQLLLQLKGWGAKCKCGLAAGLTWQRKSDKWGNSKTTHTDPNTGNSTSCMHFTKYPKDGLTLVERASNS